MKKILLKFLIVVIIMTILLIPFSFVNRAISTYDFTGIDPGGINFIR